MSGVYGKDDFEPPDISVYEWRIAKKEKKDTKKITLNLYLIPENNEYLMNIKGCMLSDAALLTVKIAGAEATGLYDLKMENAAILRKAAQDLMVKQYFLESFRFEYVKYFQTLRDMIDEYRLLFIDWVANFDKWDYLIDRWGLFNPSGVCPFVTKNDQQGNPLPARLADFATLIFNEPCLKMPWILT